MTTELLSGVGLCGLVLQVVRADDREEKANGKLAGALARPMHAKVGQILRVAQHSMPAGALWKSLQELDQTHREELFHVLALLGAIFLCVAASRSVNATFDRIGELCFLFVWPEGCLDSCKGHGGLD